MSSIWEDYSGKFLAWQKAQAALGDAAAERDVARRELVEEIGKLISNRLPDNMADDVAQSYIMAFEAKLLDTQRTYGSTPYMKIELTNPSLVVNPSSIKKVLDEEGEPAE